MMNDKTSIIATLKDEFQHWEELLAGLSEAQVTAPLEPSALSIKDEMAHLWAWQQRTIARMESVLANRKPVFPRLAAGLDPEVEDPVDQINAGIYEENTGRAWPSVHRDWRAGYLRCVELGEAIREADLLDAEKYAWLEGYPPAEYLLGSYEHHHEHRDLVLAWLGQHGQLKTAA
jgi:hypothetical protein